MAHCDDDDLAVMALGESASQTAREHLATCVECRSRLDQYTETVTAARTITPADQLVEPPDDVWHRILDELGSQAPAAALTAQAPTAATPITQARSRRGTWLIAVAAGVVGLALGAVVTSGILAQSANEQVVASTDLAPIEDSGFSGTATVTLIDDEAVLTVNVPGLPQVPDGYYEVWMATPDTATMVAIGTLNPGAETTFALPAGMEVGAFPVVDVSVENFDGDAGHSAISVVRGLLA